MVPGAGWLTSDGLSGTYTNTQPVNENPKSLVAEGGWLNGFGSLFYNRIHITPQRIDLGNLLTPQVRTVEVWNSFLVSVDLEAVTAQNNEGVTINAPVSVPGVFLPLQNVIYTISAFIDGPSVIDALFLLTIDGVDYPIFVVGSRIVIFPFLADWSDNVSEVLEWLSSVTQSDNGTEQRAQLRNSPRKALTYSIKTMTPRASQYLESLLYGWQARNFAVPNVTDRARLLTGASAGVLELELNTENLAFYPGESALLYSDFQHFEAAEVLSITPTKLNLVRPTNNPWPAGTKVLPLKVGHMDNAQSLTRKTDYHTQATLTFRLQAGPGSPAIPTSSIPVSYRGQEVYLVKPDWSVDPTFNYTNNFDTFGDGDPGLLEFSEVSPFPIILRQHRWLLRDRTQITAYKAFQGRRNGRVVPVWLPTFNADFFITANVISSATSITVEDNGYYALASSTDARRDVAIFLYGVTTPIMKHIDSVVDNGDGTVNLVFSETIGTTITKEQVSRISHLNLYRNATDALSFTWLSDTVAVVTPTFALVKG